MPARAITGIWVGGTPDSATPLSGVVCPGQPWDCPVGFWDREKEHEMARVAQGSASVDLPRFLSALKAVRQGDFSARLPDHWTGVAGKVADTFNEVVEMNQRLASELERLHLAIGRHGKITERASVGPVSGAWADSVANVNSLVESLVQPTSEAARVIGAVAKGDLSQSMALEADDHPLEGEFLRTAKTVNL